MLCALDRLCRVPSPWLTDRSYPVHGCLGPALVGHHLTAISGPCDQRPGQRAPDLRPSESQRSGAPRATAPSHQPHEAGPAPGQAPSTAPSGPPGADPDPGPRLRHRGYEHWPTSRDRGGGALWRRSGDSLPNRLAAARARSWRRWRRGNFCPAADLFGLGTFWIEDATSGLRRGHVGSDATEGRAAESGSSGRGD
jgi:hypothetical protein